MKVTIVHTNNKKQLLVSTKTMDRPLSRGIFGNNIFSHILSRTASACDARMGGAMIPVMSNSGSGNQGICATNPVVVYALENYRFVSSGTQRLEPVYQSRT